MNHHIVCLPISTLGSRLRDSAKGTYLASAKKYMNEGSANIAMNWRGTFIDHTTTVDWMFNQPPPML